VCTGLGSPGRDSIEQGCTEIADLYVADSQQHDLGRSDVAMHDAGGMGDREAICDLHSEGQGILDRQAGMFSG
jgi:hypothetical protein